MKTDVHPSDAEIQAFGQGRLSVEQAARLEGHLATCQRCGERLGRVAADTYCDLLRDSSPGVAVTSAWESPAGEVCSDLPAELRSHPRYAIQRRVGVGGMGVVYQALHRVMNRCVALKVIRPDLLATPVAVSRFRREVQTAARLSHPNIVTAFDAEEVGGAHFLVMEFVDGISLEALVAQRRTLPPQEACGLIRQAALGLDYAHGKGMIHRDVKPGNLMVTGAGVVKILDFGLACWTNPELAMASTGLTQLGARLGTVAYAAPEQLRSASEVDVRADQYGLGATLYFLLAGKHPPPAGPGRPPRRMPLELPASLPEGLRQVVERMMSLDPADRFRSITEATEALRPWCNPPAKSFRGPSRRVLLAGGVCAGAALLFGAAMAWRGWGSKPLIPLRHRDVLFILPSRGLWFEDYGPARTTLERAGIRVLVATPTGQPSELHSGSLRGSPERPNSVAADMDLASALAASGFDALICVGYQHKEFTTPDTPTSTQATQLLRQAEQKGSWVVGICAGQHVLGAAGLLRGRQIARRGKHIADFTQLGAIPQSDKVVVADGRIITASSPEDAAAAATELVRRLGTRD